MKTKNIVLVLAYMGMLSLFTAFTDILNAQTIRYVKPTASGSGNGSSWANASGNIQGMIDASTVGDQVWIAGGTYLIATTLEMKNGVNVFGGFKGSESNINARSKSDLDANGTIENWEFTNESVLDGQNQRRIVNQANPFAMETTWDGITITKGVNVEGAGVYIRTNGKLNNCIIKQNSTTTTGNVSGAGIYNNGGVVNSCVVSENTTSTSTSNSKSYGGGIYNNGGAINNCVISGNTSSSSSNSNGGGIYNNGGVINTCIVSENTSFSKSYYDYSNTYSLGGGIYNDEGEVNTCIISGNISSSTCNPSTNSSSNSYGGGIYDNEGTISNCMIKENISSSQSRSYGGGIACTNTISLINICTLENNKTIINNIQNGEGGGIWQGSITRCIIKKNTTGVGGGLYQSLANNCLLLNNNASANGGGTYAGINTNCTFVGNMATNQGGGMFQGTATNCIFWINDAITGFQIYNGSVAYSAVHGGYSGIGNIDITQNNENGGAMFVNPATENFQLNPCSPCVNKGYNNVVSNPAITTDLIGEPRIYQYSSNGIVDMGAYELQNSNGNFDLKITSSIQENNLILGTDVTFNATYLWSTGATTSSISVTTAGNYSVEVTNTAGCSSTDNTNVVFLSDTICDGDYYDFYGQNITEQGVYCKMEKNIIYKLSLNVLQLPPTPTITQTGLLLTSSSPINNQWYFNDAPIPDATGQTYQCTQSGNYAVSVFNSNNCFAYAYISIEFIPDDEMAALRAIYQSTNGDSWTFSWDINNPYSVGNWYGITIQNNSVYSIDLSNNNLTGTLPVNLGSLPFINEFNVSNNKIGGNLPTDISGLKNTDLRLNFSKNRFTGNIPSCYNIKSGNVVLNVSENRLNSLETILGYRVALDIKNQEIWSSIAVQINPGMDIIISLPNICTYDHSSQNFSANNSFSVYLEEDNIGTVTSEQGILIIPAIMLANATPATALTLVQSKGDAQGTKIRYNQGSNPETYSIKGQVTHNGNPLSGVNILFEGGSSVTNASGNYNITVDRNATITLTPSLYGYIFNPSFITCSNVTSNLTGKDFVVTSSGIKETSNEEQQIIIFPNPVMDILSIESQDIIISLKLFDLKGKILSEINPNTNEVKLNFGSYAQGIYILHIWTDKGDITKKIIKN